jgi:hypothetical protein
MLDASGAGTHVEARFTGTGVMVSVELAKALWETTIWLVDVPPVPTQVSRTMANVGDPAFAL